MALASTNIENDPEDALGGSPAAGGAMQRREMANAPKGALGQMGSGGAGDLPEQLSNQIRGLEETRTKKKAVIDDAIKSLAERETPSGPSAGELFRLMGAFAAPTRTGGFSESLGNVGNVSADMLDKRQASKGTLQDLKTKYKLQGLDVDSEHLKDVVDATKTLQAANAPASVYGKTAQDEGLKPGTPGFAARVQELATADLENKTAKAQGGNKPGQFDAKTGNYVAPNGTVIKAPEIKEDRANRDAIVKLQQSVQQITPEIAKKAEGWDWTGSDTSKFIAGKLMPKQLAAQVKVNAGALQERLKNLPPGPASDKDISQARSSFPGFSDSAALNEWVKTTNAAIDNYMKIQDGKYGDVQWYGAGKTPGTPSTPAGAGDSAKSGAGEKPPASPGAAPGNPTGATPDDKGRYKAGPAPKVGAVYKGYRYIGGDPSQKESYEKI